MACCSKETNMVSKYLYRFASNNISNGASQADGTVISDGVFEIDCVSYNPGEVTKLLQARLLSSALDASAGLEVSVRLHLFSINPTLSAGDSVEYGAGFSYLGYVDFTDYTTIAAPGGTPISFGMSYGSFPSNWQGYFSPESSTRMIYGVLQNKSGGAMDCTDKTFFVELIFEK